MIEINNITICFERNVILENISFIIYKNDLVFIKGKNGTGKTSLLNLLTKQLPLSSFSGEVINKFDSICFMPDKYCIPSYIKPKKFIRLYSECSGDIVNEYLIKYKIDNLYISKLSLGTKQKVLMIATILKEASLYVFDEPLIALDLSSKRLFKEDVEMLIKNGKTVVISTHNNSIFNKMNYKTVLLGDKRCKISKHTHQK